VQHTKKKTNLAARSIPRNEKFAILRRKLPNHKNRTAAAARVAAVAVVDVDMSTLPILGALRRDPPFLKEGKEGLLPD
jgi:hypothetical protein